MSLDHNRWVNTLPNVRDGISQEKYNLDSNRWINTLPKINKSNPPIKKYFITVILFVVGLIFVSAIKNETRNLQKETSNLLASINTLRLDLHQATLDHEVITSPENISRLAKEYLEPELIFYRKSQIKQLNKNKNISITPEKTEFTKGFNEIVKDKKSEMKLIFAKKIEAKKTELIKLQELYTKPEEIPKELKLRVAKTIETKKHELNELKKLYSEPTSIFTSKKMQQWVGLQVVKVFLGIPIVPGK